MSNEPKPTKEQKKLTLEEEVAELIGKPTLAKLGKQPLAIRAGGVDAAIKQAVSECRGCLNPIKACASRTLQICGSKGNIDRLKNDR